VHFQLRTQQLDSVSQTPQGVNTSQHLNCRRTNHLAAVKTLHYFQKIDTTYDLHTRVTNLTLFLHDIHTILQTPAFARQITHPTSLFAVEVAVDHAGDGLDLGGQLLLDLVQREAVLVGDEVDGQTQVAETARATDAVQVGLGALGEVEVDHNVHTLDVDTAGEQVRAHQVAGRAVAELVEHSTQIVKKVNIQRG